MFIRCSEDPNFEICKRTKSTRAKGKTKPQKRTDGICAVAEKLDVTTADHRVLKVGNVSRDGHRDVCIFLMSQCHKCVKMQSNCSRSCLKTRSSSVCRISKSRPHFQRTDVQFFLSVCRSSLFLFLLIEAPALALCVDDLCPIILVSRKKAKKKDR